MNEREHMPESIALAVCNVMSVVKNVEKRGTNDFHRYKFAKVEDLLFQVQPAMVEAGLIITQDEIRHQIEDGALILATYAFSLSHASGATWGPIHQTGVASLRNSKGGYDDKALNKCHTAARKYFILGLFQVPAGDLPDVDTEEDKPAPKLRHATASPVSEGRKSAAQCKRDGDDVRIKTEIASLDRNGLKDWDVNFDAYTAHVPASWSDSIRDMLEARLVELDGEDAVRAAAADMDAGFSGAVAA